MNKQQEPRLRFKGFTGAWQEKTIFELAQDNKLNNGVFNDKNKAGSGYKLINVLDMYLENGIDENTLQLLDLSHDEFLRNKVNYGDVFFTRSSLVKEGIAYSNTYLGSSNDVTYDGHLIKLTPNKNLVSPIFLNYELKTAAVRRQFIIGGKTTTMTTIGQQEIGESIVMLPLLPEQTHLGNFFRRLDSQIAESRAVLEKSRQLKKAMLAKMFPANGEKIPQIRFKGFEGEWECRKFSDVAELRRGLTYSPLDIAPNGIRVLRSSNIDEENYIEKNDDVFVCERAVNIPLVQNGDILITAANGSSRLVGKHTIIQTSMPAVHGGFMLLARTENPYFLNASMSSSWYLDFIRIFVAGGNGAIGNLSIGDLNEQEILIPKTLEEQTAIGNFFRQLDETIALQSAEVEKLNQLKKGLLAAMLV